jgi:hypothetical protein
VAVAEEADKELKQVRAMLGSPGKEKPVAKCDPFAVFP